MADLAAVEADDLKRVRSLSTLLGARLGNVADFITVAALGQTAINNLTGVSKTLEVLVDVLGPRLAVARAGRVPLEAIGDRVLLAEVALEIHVGESDCEGLLNGDEPDSNVMGAEGTLKFDIGGLGGSLDVGLNGLLDVVDVTLLGGTQNENPSIVGAHVGQVVAVDLASILAGADSVA